MPEHVLGNIFAPFYFIFFIIFEYAFIYVTALNGKLVEFIYPGLTKFFYYNYIVNCTPPIKIFNEQPGYMWII